jgi:hypothetical protein
LASDVPQVFIAGGASGVTVYWNTNFAGYALQFTTKLAPPFAWQTIAGPYSVDGVNFEHGEAMGTLAPAKFFRIISP